MLTQRAFAGLSTVPADGKKAEEQPKVHGEIFCIGKRRDQCNGIGIYFDKEYKGKFITAFVNLEENKVIISFVPEGTQGATKITGPSTTSRPFAQIAPKYIADAGEKHLSVFKNRMIRFLPFRDRRGNISYSAVELDWSSHLCKGHMLSKTQAAALEKKQEAPKPTKKAQGTQARAPRTEVIEKPERTLSRNSPEMKAAVKVIARYCQQDTKKVTISPAGYFETGGRFVWDDDLITMQSGEPR